MKLANPVGSLIVLCLGCALPCCGNPIPDGYPVLEGSINQAFEYTLDGTASECTTEDSANSHSDDINVYCEGEIKIHITIDKTTGDQTAECGDVSVFNSDGYSYDCVTSGTIHVDGLDDSYVWGRFEVEFSAHSFTNGKFSAFHKDKGVADPG